ncbi:MAG: 4a-hydroxytetrahydrobiopterin dehydratase [Candidatus Omnitrophica bacterium]|nr:4a-hydroxytetrahydrobiopterin dehydratase [Candidatus Omnitrophota bacterium]
MAGAEKLSGEAVAALLREIPGWEQTGGRITKTYKFKEFMEAIRFVNKVAGCAESQDHHPGILILYNKVTLTLSTHSAGGLTPKDFQLAKTIDSSAS